MHFEVLPNSSQIPSSGTDIAYLLTDNWNDWFKYQTMYFLVYYDSHNEKHEIGSVKIGQFNMQEDQSRPAIPSSFDEINEQFFSLGQDVDYYTTIMSLGQSTAIEMLGSLKDISHDEELYKKAIDEDVTGVSLLRYVNMKTIEGQFRRILKGDAVLTPYKFHYTGPKPLANNAAPIELDFTVKPDSRPSTNIHVLIGRNGVGKSFILNSMTRALISSDSESDNDGHFTSEDAWGDSTHENPFANILSISFSAFDDFKIIKQRRNATKGVRYINVGLRKRVKDRNNEWISTTKDPDDLAKSFADSAKACSTGLKSKRWYKALKTLESDPLFEEANVTSLADEEVANFARTAGSLYRRLSTGHKIVLLTITKLVENVEEKTLVLMDEPEAHLHPPLLSAFIRALSDLLINRNGVAVIATHSPVVLQEVPQSCVWKIIRHGGFAKSERPTIETFAENVGTLTGETFGLEVTRSGFHKMILDSIEDDDSLNNVVDRFDNKVGSEGRALVSSMIANRHNG